MPNISKVGDKGSGTCPHSSHGTPQAYDTIIIVGASTVFVEGKPCATVNSIGASSCGHPTTALIGDSTVFANGQPVHRIGDTGANYGAYTMIEGSSTVSANQSPSSPSSLTPQEMHDSLFI